MKTIFSSIGLALISVFASAQNWTTVSATNITDLNQQKLAVGQLCFLATDQNDAPISFNVGGGGQVLKRAFCSAVTNGTVTSFTVPNPVNTTPSGIYYRVTVKDVNTSQEVLRYSQVGFSGATFNFDSYAPLNVGQFTPITGNAVSGNLSVNGNLAITGSFSGSNLNLPATGTATSAANFSSAGETWTGSYWNGTSAANDSWSVQNSLGTGANPGAFFGFTHSGVIGANAYFQVNNANFQLAPTTQATSGANVNSPQAILTGFYWNGSASAGDSWQLVNSLGTGTNPSSTLALTHFGSSGAAAVDFSSVSTLKTGAVNAAGNAVTAGIFKSNSTNPATTGQVELAAGDAIKFRNNANTADVNALSKNTSDVVQLGGGAGIALSGSSSGTTTISAAAAASGSLTLPSATDTLVGRATTDTLTNKTFDAEATGNSITLPFYVQLPTAGCNSATAIPNWNLPATNAPTPNCLTGTNTQQGSMDFDHTAARTMQTVFNLPPGWTPPKVLTAEEEEKFFRVAAGNPDWSVAYWAASLTNNTSAMGIELRYLQLKHIFLEQDPPTIHIPDTKVKNEFRARVVPLNAIAAKQVGRIVDRAKKLGAWHPDHYIFPFRVKKGTYEVTKPASPYFLRSAFRSMRKVTGLDWLQPRNFRNQVITKLFESGAPDETIMSIAGHQSIRMSRYYSRIRIAAKAEALNAICPVIKKKDENGNR